MTRRFLLVTDIPPARNYSGGLHLEALCRLIPAEALEIVAIVNPYVPVVPADLAGVRLRYVQKPDELIVPRGGRFADASAFAAETKRTFGARRRVARLTLEHVHTSRPDTLWCLLEGQTMIQVGRYLRRRWPDTFLTQVMDPPLWWLNAHHVDRRWRRRLLDWFEDVIRSSDRCGTASWAMADRYRELYGVDTVPLVPSLAATLVESAEGEGDREAAFVIGVAGQIYATDSWEGLLAALDLAGWRVDDRDVILRIVGPRAPNIAHGSPRVEFLGWHSQGETLRLLAACDVLYCPYWFDPAFEEEARLSFPSKLTSYFAAGRPVLFHGPAYSSPAEFLEREQAGLCCTSLDPKEMLSSLTALAGDRALRDDLRRNARSALRKHLSVDAQRAHLSRFLGVDEAFLTAA